MEDDDSNWLVTIADLSKPVWYRSGGLQVETAPAPGQWRLQDDNDQDYASLSTMLVQHVSSQAVIFTARVVKQSNSGDSVTCVRIVTRNARKSDSVLYWDTMIDPRTGAAHWVTTPYGAFGQVVDEGAVWAVSTMALVNDTDIVNAEGQITPAMGRIGAHFDPTATGSVDITNIAVRVLSMEGALILCNRWRRDMKAWRAAGRALI
jgi:hypothetical protein